MGIFADFNKHWITFDFNFNKTGPNSFEGPDPLTAIVAGRNSSTDGDLTANNAKESGDDNTKDEVKPKKLTAFHNESFHDKTNTLKIKCILSS